MPNGRRATRKQAATAQPTIEQLPQPPRLQQFPPAPPALPLPPPARIVTAREVSTWFFVRPAELPDLSAVEALSAIVTSAVLANETDAREVLISWSSRESPLPNLCGPPHGPLGLPGDYVLVRWIVNQHPLVHLGLFHGRDPRLAKLRAKLKDKARDGHRIATHPPAGLGGFAVVAVRMARFWVRICNEFRERPS